MHRASFRVKRANLRFQKVCKYQLPVITVCVILRVAVVFIFDKTLCYPHLSNNMLPDHKAFWEL
jgi:hypothetical protein